MTQAILIIPALVVIILLLSRKNPAIRQAQGKRGFQTPTFEWTRFPETCSGYYEGPGRP